MPLAMTFNTIYLPLMMIVIYQSVELNLPQMLSITLFHLWKAFITNIMKKIILITRPILLDTKKDINKFQTMKLNHPS